MKKLLLSLIAVFFIGNVFAQSGTVKYYSINTNIDYKKEFSLTFNKHESLLVFDVKPFEYTTSQGFTVNSPGQYNAVYLNTKTKEGIIYKRKKKKKLIQAPIILEAKDWVIHRDFKVVAGHKVQRATLSYDYQPKVEEPVGMGKIEVWFAVHIPVNAGPNVFDGNLDFIQWGLPGLILEVNYDAAWSVKAFDVNLSKTPVALEKPTATEKVTFGEFWFK